ncbi:MAG: sensor histidine kinase [Xanthomonadales bacterium]|nr:sensor histidine kinase [Xanthomonadales bacterium]
MKSIRHQIRRLHHFLVPAHLELGLTPYLWIVYNGFLAFPFIFGDPGPLAAAVTIASMVVFLPTYFMALRTNGRRLAPYLGMLTALGVFVMPFNGAAMVYFIHACAYAPFLGQPRDAIRVILVIVLAASLEALLLGLHPSYALMTLIFGPLVGLSNIYWRKMQLRTHALQQSREEVRKLAQAAERERIARDLHDLLGHTLSTITLKSELAGRLIDRDMDKARLEIAEIERISRQGLAEVRAAVTGYRSGRIRSELASARHLLESSGIWLEYEVSEFDLDQQVENVVALVMREALTNVARHSNASRCDVVLTQTEQETHVNIQDDGRGGSLKPGSGLSGMRERVEELGGEISIESNVPRGVLVDIRIPRRPDTLPLGEPELI